jgi:uncharacterized protein (DUF305 family)
VTAAALTAALSGCGDTGGSDGQPSATRTASDGTVFNEADVAFATAMVPHHAQAIEMVTLTDGRTLDPEVKALADAIRAGQAPEVETMTDWLVAWGEDVPETSLDHVNAGHGGEPSEELAELAAAPDGEFEELWLEMMEKHHEGAVEMAEREQEDGEHDDALALAEQIETTQRAELERIDALRGE